MAIITNIFGNISGNKYKIYEKDWSKFDRENFILDYFSVDWEDLLKIDKLNADNLTKMYLDAINMLLDTYTYTYTLLNLSFMTGVFPSVLKTAKVVPVFKKNSKLDYSNYRPITLLSNVEKNT